ncbi:phosphoglucosamine mutase [Limnobacter humi]|uniref:Phosphoglucosamine mutase n=1 Tax=Limnobacter humi TaxID=1778671 RepID=A0ABT1WGY5_9BURK|nr:phosphoglucosamine mutase [Limnobacter humi]MCQ8896793.1 phosphoglucosamine mutase [Limnobacter humi]
MSRQYFGTDGIRGTVGQSPMTPDFILRLGQAAGLVIARHERGSRRPTVLIGKDTRVSGYLLESCLEAGLTSVGVDVVLVGPMPTAGIAYLTRTLNLSAGVVISASHNPYPDNGIKFFSGQGTKLPDEWELEIEQQLQGQLPCNSSVNLGKAKRLEDAAGRYIEFCKSTFPRGLDLRGLKVVVDCANGAAYHIAPAVFRELGAEVVVMADQPNGLNINDGVGATHPEAVSKAVLENKADYGFALDGDADRLICVDSNGRIFNGDELLFVLVAHRLGTGLPVPGVVGTLMSNMGLELALTGLGIAFERAKVGDRYVFEKLQERGWQLGGESSGHLLVLDRHSTGDGIVSALQVLGAVQGLGQPLAHILSPVVMMPQVLKNARLPAGYVWSNDRDLAAACEQVRAELVGQGRLLIRPSGTEPVLRVMVEARDTARAEGLVDRLLAVLPKASG